jgi:hypothetical protein
MIKNFEQITFDFTSDEWSKMGAVMDCMIAYLPTEKKNLRKQSEIALYIEMNVGIETDVIRVRKYINYFRSTGILPIIATSQGCFISYEAKYLESQIQSLQGRINGLQNAKNGLQKIYDKIISDSENNS